MQRNKDTHVKRAKQKGMHRSTTIFSGSNTYTLLTSPVMIESLGSSTLKYSRPVSLTGSTVISQCSDAHISRRELVARKAYFSVSTLDK